MDIRAQLLVSSADPDPDLEVGYVHTTADSAPPSKKSRAAKYTQMTLCNGVITRPHARAQLDIAIADFIHSNLLSFSIAGCLKFQRVLDLAG